VLDYILFGIRFQTGFSIRDCRVFGGVDLDLYHRLVMMTLKLRFSSSRSKQRQQPGRCPAAMKFHLSNLQQGC
jgi:hypothetical protein